MTAISSTQSGNWSATATWAGGVVPVNGDTVTIAAGHTVTFDVDQSGVASGIGLTINGVLQASETAGAYYLKCNGADVLFGAAGKLKAGSVSSAYPDTCTFTLEFTNASSHSLNIGTNNTALELYCAVPTNSYAITTAAALINDTTLSIDRNLTTDKWRVGDLVDVCNINKGRQVAELTVSSIDATSITFTTGVPFATVQGTYVVLARRNVRIVGLKTNGNHRGVTGAPTNVGNVARAEWRNLFYVSVGTVNINWDNSLMVVSANGLWINGQTISNVTAVNSSTAIYAHSNNKWTSCLFAGNTVGMTTPNNDSLVACLFVGNTSAITNDAGNLRVSGCSFVGNGTAIYYIFDSFITASSFVNNSTGLFYVSARVVDCTFSANSVDVVGIDRSDIRFVNCSPSSLSILATPITAADAVANFIRQINTGANTDVSRGLLGTIVKVVDIVPTGYSYAWHYTQTDNAHPLYFDQPLRIENITYRLDVWLRQSVALGTPLTVNIFPSYVDPHFSGAASTSVSLTSGAINTWEQKTIDAVLPTGDYIMRVEASHTVANAEWWVAWKQLSASPATTEAISNMVNDMMFIDNFVL